MNDIIVLNNQAIVHLQRGNVHSACSIMTGACSYVLLQYQQDQQRPATMRKNLRDCTISWAPISQCCQRDVTEDIDKEDSPNIYPYAPALIKPCCQSEFSTKKTCCSKCQCDADVCPSNVAPILWYNLGLCYQLLGLDMGHDTPEGLYYFGQATRLYGRVYTSCGGRDTQPSAGLSTMKMAVLNNQGGIYFDMGLQDACSEVMDSLAHVLTSISHSFLCRRWKIFYRNLMALDGSPRPAAAA